MFQRRGGGLHSAPSVVAERHAERSVLLAKRAVAEYIDAAGGRWAAEGKHGFRREAAAGALRMVHQVAADLVREIRELLIFRRAQQDLCSLDTMRREHDQLGAFGVRLAAPVKIVDRGYGTSACVRFQ